MQRAPAAASVRSSASPAFSAIAISTFGPRSSVAVGRERAASAAPVPRPTRSTRPSCARAAVGGRPAPTRRDACVAGSGGAAQLRCRRLDAAPRREHEPVRVARAHDAWRAQRRRVERLAVDTRQRHGLGSAPRDLLGPFRAVLRAAREQDSAPRERLRGRRHRASPRSPSSFAQRSAPSLRGIRAAHARRAHAAGALVHAEQLVERTPGAAGVAVSPCTK